MHLLDRGEGFVGSWAGGSPFNCQDFRRDYRTEHSAGDAKLTPAERTHLDGCAACRQWCAQVDDMARVAELPQFDVPERLTQNIMATVEDESRRPLFGHYGLLLPLGIACAAVSFTLLPLDSVEGLGATAVAAAMMFVINLFIRLDKSEGVMT